MTKIAVPMLVLALAATPALAQTTTTQPAPSQAPSAVSPSTSAGSVSTPVLTEDQAKAWINKPVYSSDNKNLGEVAAFAREPSGKVTEMHADIGGFLGLGETRVRVMPAQFKLAGDRVIVNMTAEQAKALPKLPK
jgi:hypothetical protein